MMLALLPKVPLMMRVALLHMLRLTPQSKYLDLRTELTIAILRSFTNPSTPRSITATQRMAAQAPELKGRIWVSTYACPPPPAEERGLQDAIAKAIDELRDPRVPTPTYEMPEPARVEAEWTGYRADATPNSRLPDLPERDLYAEMMKEVKSPATVLYFHGGAYYLLDPANHRPTTKKLAKLTGGRVYSVRYRLAPQNPFPAALMDALMSYLALLYPPEGAFHEAVKPEHIVFAGDSAGGNLSLALLQLILHLQRNSHTVLWHGAARAVPLPGGVAVNSPWLDITHSSPSCTANAAFDYLPTLDQQLAAEARRPPCPAWPASPPRRHLYAPDSLLGHPLVSPVTARSWAGAPPVYVCAGWELLADEDKFAAHKMWREGVAVVWEEYEAMPHCFAIVLPYLREARRCLEGWAAFIKAVAEGGPTAAAAAAAAAATPESRFLTIRAKSLEEVAVEPDSLWTDGEEVVAERVWRKVRERLVPEESVAKL
ncbi:alpha/beta hydrolase fold-domain-containing protein [Thermothelomyces heterothallicus CBS 202.75]|uniref:alpha/beta hydrolase fold-domain-containing protein n=1 Tax=Thermothelomyces heterothallicus CBS 202.75 TaxID=1149848 RepID=UPI0037447E11